MCSFEREQERLRAILAELDSEEEEIGGEISDNEVHNEIESNHDSQTEQEATSDNENLAVVNFNENNYVGRDGSIWRKYPFRQGRTGRENIFINQSNLTDNSKDVRTPIESWNKFFTFIDQIVENTNLYITKQQVNYKNIKHARTTDNIEINSLLGLLYLSGLHKSSHVNVKDLFATDGTGLEIFTATMSYGRFLFLMCSLRFDNLNTREDRRLFDKLAPIREIFDVFNKNCKDNYNVGSYVTVDEKLESFRGRCSFRQYIPNKPAKYGIKIFSAVDSITYYTSHLEVYCGQQPPGPYNLCNKPEAIVKRITAHLQNAGRNITCDNWFTTHSLATDLLEKKTTLVGTIRKNKRVLPASFSISKHRSVKSTIFGYKKKMTILSYIPKKNKCVLLLSTMHRDGNIIEGPKLLPEIIEFYNKTKGGVDTTDQLCGTYNVARNSRRWPLVVFFSLVNLASINARIILLLTDNPPIMYKKRSLFIKHLAMALIQEQIDRRLKSNMSSHLKSICQKFVSKNPTNIRPKEGDSSNEIPEYSEPLEKKRKSDVKGRCQICKYTADRKTRTTCHKCNKYICGSHLITICINCNQPKTITVQESSDSDKDM